MGQMRLIKYGITALTLTLFLIPDLFGEFIHNPNIRNGFDYYKDNVSTATYALTATTATHANIFNVTNYIKFRSTGTPATPAAENSFLYAVTTQGHTRPTYMDDDGVEFVINRDNVVIARNTSGATIAKGQAVHVTGSTGNVPNVSLAKADSLTTLPAIGITVAEIADNAFGNVMLLGILTMIDTSDFSAGDRVFVSSATAGTLTATRPVSPAYAQRMGSVLVSGVGNGAIEVTAAPFVGGEESGTSAEVWSAYDVHVSSVTFPDGTVMTTADAGLFEIDINGGLQPISGSSTDPQWELDGDGGLIPK